MQATYYSDKTQARQCKRESPSPSAGGPETLRSPPSGLSESSLLNHDAGNRQTPKKSRPALQPPSGRRASSRQQPTSGQGGSGGVGGGGSSAAGLTTLLSSVSQPRSRPRRRALAARSRCSRAASRRHSCRSACRRRRVSKRREKLQGRSLRRLVQMGSVG